MNPGSKYVQLLMQNMGGYNNGTHAGGLAHALQSGLNGYIVAKGMAAEEAERKRKLEEAERQRQAMAQAAQAMAGRPEQTIEWEGTERRGGFMPDAQGDPTTTFAARAPDRSRAMQLLAQEPSTAPMAFDMMLADSQADREMQAKMEFERFKAQLPQPAAEAPSTVREWQFFSGLNPQQQEAYLSMKRANRPVDLGYGLAVPSQVVPGQVQGVMPKGQAPTQSIQDGRVIRVPGQAPQGITSAPPSGMPQVSPPPSSVPQPGRASQNPRFKPPIPEMPAGSPSVIDLPPSPQENRKVEEKRKADQAAYNAFSVGLGNVQSAMAETTTGPLVGRLPPISAEAQTADGAAATLAPVLKSLFRTAGEGTFTDKDQELLMQMVPTRQDLPAARDAKIQMIDQMVRAKLGIDGGGQPPSGASAPLPLFQAPDLGGVETPQTPSGMSDEDLLRKYGLQP